MAIHFLDIQARDVQIHFPKFYDSQGYFFEIICTNLPGVEVPSKDQPIGFVGIRPRASREREDCELEVFIFKGYRNALTKGIVLAVLDLPRLLPGKPVPGEPVQFKRCWMQTTRKSVVKLLNSMGKYGIMPVGPIKGKHVFVREF